VRRVFFALNRYTWPAVQIAGGYGAARGFASGGGRSFVLMLLLTTTGLLVSLGTLQRPDVLRAWFVEQVLRSEPQRWRNLPPASPLVTSRRKK
jgi:hypothetical protein